MSKVAVRDVTPQEIHDHWMEKGREYRKILDGTRDEDLIQVLEDEFIDGANILGYSMQYRAEWLQGRRYTLHLYGIGDGVTADIVGYAMSSREYTIELEPDKYDEPDFPGYDYRIDVTAMTLADLRKILEVHFAKGCHLYDYEVSA